MMDEAFSIARLTGAGWELAPAAASPVVVVAAMLAARPFGGAANRADWRRGAEPLVRGAAYKQHYS